MSPFIGAIVKMTYIFVPGDDKKIGYRDSHQLKYIGEKVVFNPATAVVEVIKELDRVASLASENLNRAPGGIRYIFRMIADPLDIIDDMEQRTEAL